MICATYAEGLSTPRTFMHTAKLPATEGSIAFRNSTLGGDLSTCKVPIRTDHPNCRTTQLCEKIRIRGNRSGLVGPGRIIQQHPGQPIIEIEDADTVEMRGLILTRPEGKTETGNEGILAIRCTDPVVDSITLINNQTRSAAIAIRECRGTQMSHCLIRNYMRVSVDDRTASPEWGYAFNCTDGTGISVNQSTGILIDSNRVIESRLTPIGSEAMIAFRFGLTPASNPTIRRSPTLLFRAIESNVSDHRVTNTPCLYPVD